MGKGDSWGDPTESGLLDDFDFDVKEAWFGEREDSDDERIFLFLRGDAVDDQGDDVEDHEERYSVGSNWEVVEDGEEVENALGRNKFNRNTGIGHLINTFVALGDDVLAMLGKKGDTYQAQTYVGLNMHMNSKVVSRFKDDDGEDVEWSLNLPTEVKAKGKGKKKAGGKGKASRSSADKPAPKAKKKASGSSKLRAAISEFAGEFDEDEHDEFVDQVLDDEIFDRAEDILDDDELHADVLDPDSDLWSDAH